MLVNIPTITLHTVTHHIFPRLFPTNFQIPRLLGFPGRWPPSGLNAHILNHQLSTLWRRA